MPFDGTTTKLITSELKSALTGGRIRKIYQPEEDEIRLLINNNGENKTLVISSNASNARIHLTNTKKENPDVPPTFCMSLRKHILNSEIESVSQLSSDRVIVFKFTSRDELGEAVTLHLIVEITGKNSNIILTKVEDNNEVILDALKRINVFKNRYRQILPGENYNPPPVKNRHNFNEIDEEDFRESLEESSNKNLEEFLTSYFLGLSPALAREICYRAQLDSNALIPTISSGEKTRLINATVRLLSRLDQAVPRVFYSGEKLLDYSGINLTNLNAEEKTYESYSQMLEDFYSLRDKRMHFKSKSANLRHELESQERKLSKKLQNLDRDLKKAEKNAKNKLYGDLITANIYRLERGMKEAELEDYTKDPVEIVKVPLKVNESPSQNAQRFYKKYNKNKRAQVELKKQIEKTRENLDYIESLTNALSVSTEIEELDEIKDEYRNSGLVKKRSSKKIKKPKASKPMHFVSSEGFDIYVGKNNYQNDYLVTRVGRDEDCWLHVKDAAGSHVLIVADGKFITEQTVLEGGMLAATYSKLSQSENIPVDYLEFKFLKKPRKSKPGFVTFTEHNTMYITPKKEVIENLERIE